MRTIEISGQRAHAVIGIQHGLFGFLNFQREPCFQRLAFANQIFQSNGFFLKGSGLTPCRVHFRIQLAKFALER